jgi:hypothetical protein
MDYAIGCVMMEKIKTIDFLSFEFGSQCCSAGIYSMDQRCSEEKKIWAKFVFFFFSKSQSSVAATDVVAPTKRLSFLVLNFVFLVSIAQHECKELKLFIFSSSLLSRLGLIV